MHRSKILIAGDSLYLLFYLIGIVCCFLVVRYLFLYLFVFFTQPLPPEEEKELKETLQEVMGKGKKVNIEQKVHFDTETFLENSQ